MSTVDDKGNRANHIMDRLKARLCRINGNVQGKQTTVSDTGIFRLIAPVRPRDCYSLRVYDMRAVLAYSNLSASKYWRSLPDSLLCKKTRFFDVYIVVY